MKNTFENIRLRVAIWIMPKAYRIAIIQTQAILKQAGVTINALIGHIKRMTEDKEQDGPYIH